MSAQAASRCDSSPLYAGIVTISVIGLALNHLLVLVERRFSRWRA
ncbi:hypothetical protein [Flexivirga endophytica]|nr:hypothetical protein [Flexivirga endophytica]